MSHDFFIKHQDTLAKALDACAKRYAWTAYTESPSSKIHGKDIPAIGKGNFESMLGKPFAIALPFASGQIGEEISPFTQQALGISYPKVDIDKTFAAARQALSSWRNTSTQDRIGLCLEMLDQCGQASALFENAYATMHTAGQSFVMAFAGCGANALDRGLEALAYSYKAMTDIPETVEWQRSFGGKSKAALTKRFRIMPRGVAVVMTCATFPQWNGYPAIMANLATGNPVILKPHPNTILPVALFVRLCRNILSQAGYDPNLVTMIADTREHAVAVELLQHRDTAIIDFTGGQTFGNWIEENCHHAQVYTETSGCNSVIVESTDDLHSMATAIAHSLCQASAQMCTSVQNIFIPESGIKANGQRVSFDAVANAIINVVDELMADAKQADFLCGALINDDIYATIEHMRELVSGRGTVLRDSAPYTNTQFPNARTASPLIIKTNTDARELYRQERFGPVSFMIATKNATAALTSATTDARECGAITAHVYSVDDEFLDKAEEAYHQAGASVAFNLTDMPINFAAAYSDFHVTGLNPAGNACLTDLAFVTNRFRLVQTKRPIK